MGSNFKKTDVIPIVMKLKLKLHPTAWITLQSSLSFDYGQGVFVFGVFKNNCVGMFEPVPSTIYLSYCGMIMWKITLYSNDL